MRRSHRTISTLAGCALFFLALVSPSGNVWAAPCTTVVHDLNQKLHPKIDEPELVALLDHLNRTGNAQLPAKFLTKREAKRLGWKPGTSLWAYQQLRGKSIGGDVFYNREGKLRGGGKTWREADLDYKGGHRGAKRLLFSNDGLRMVTVDHYRSFKEVPACQ